MAEVEVRLVGPEDWTLWRETRLRALLESPDAFGSTYAREVCFDEMTWRQRATPPATLALADGEPVALGSGFEIRAGWCHVVAMWTDPAWRGRGLAHAVLDVVVTWASEQGARVDLDVAQSHSAARRVYERYGFAATGEVAPLRAGSATLMERMVLPVRSSRRAP